MSMDKLKDNDKVLKKDKKEVIITSRMLFVSVLDKICLSVLALIFCMLNFALFSCCYEVGEKILWEIVVFIVVFCCYLLFNWYYKCICKTMLGLTKNGVYKFSYFPFYKKETFIPLNKITSVASYNFLWIFRAVIIHRYSAVPLVFFTWNNQDFKDELDYLITNEIGVIDNDYKRKNIITKEQHGFLVLLGFIVILVLAIGFQGCIFIHEKEPNLEGTYYLDGDVWNSRIKLMSDGDCRIDDDIVDEDVISCSWDYYESLNEVRIKYEYYDYYDKDWDFIYLDYDCFDKTLEYDDDVFEKKR